MPKSWVIGLVSVLHLTVSVRYRFCRCSANVLVLFYCVFFSIIHPTVFSCMSFFFFIIVLEVWLDSLFSYRNSMKFNSSKFSQYTERMNDLHLLFLLPNNSATFLKIRRLLLFCSTILFIFPTPIMLKQNHSEGYYFTSREACRQTAGETHTLIKV